MRSGLKNSYECVVSLGESDFTHDLELSLSWLRPLAPLLGDPR